MIHPMKLIAFATGALISWWVLSGRRIDYVLILFYFARNRTKRAFNALYDIADDEATWSFNSANTEIHIKSYADYLRLHEATRKTAYVRFRVFYNALLKLLLTRILPIALMPAVLFLSHWCWYLLGVVVALIVIVLHKTYIVGHKIGFYQRMIVGATISNYQKEQQRKTK